MLARALTTVFLTCALAVQALATPGVATRDDNLVDIAPTEWFDLVRGRTVVYRIGPDVWAYESYPRSGRLVSIQLADGTCMDGTWDHVDGAYCFAWENREYSCFRHARDGANILIIPVVDGVQSGTIQTVSDITDAAVGCGNGLVS